MQVKFKLKKQCRGKTTEQLESLCPDCELNATGSTHGCIATVFTKEDEKFFRLFTQAYIYAKLNQKGAYIIDAIRDFGRRKKISGDVQTLAFHFFFWRKEILPNEAKLMVHAVEEMRDLAQRKFDSTKDANWGKVSVALEKYVRLLEVSATLQIPLEVR